MSGRTVTLKYFAWLRERIGVSEEVAALPENVTTVPALLDWLESRGDVYAHAMQARAIIRVALNKTVVPADADLDDATEIALFPPMTGG